MNFFKNLSKSEKVYLKIGGAIAAFILYLFIIFLPLMAEEENYRKRAEKKEIALKEVALMSARYSTLKGRMERLKNESKSEKDDFTLFSFLDSMAADSGVKKNIKAMKPSVQTLDDYVESTVVVELEDVSLQPLIKYIHGIESSGHNLRIKRADIKPRYSNPEIINVTLLISSVEMI